MKKLLLALFAGALFTIGAMAQIQEDTTATDNNLTDMQPAGEADRPGEDVERGREEHARVGGVDRALVGRRARLVPRHAGRAHQPVDAGGVVRVPLVGEEPAVHLVDLEIRAAVLDAEAEIERMAEQSGESARRIRARLEKEDMMEAVAAEMIERKALDLILDSATYEDVKIGEELQEGVASVEEQVVPGEMRDVEAEAAAAQKAEEQGAAPQS